MSGFAIRPDEPVLCDFNLHIRPGETVALVGHTGAGKSSIAKLIARFYEFQQGNMLIDGQDIRTFDLPQYRSQLGIVSQTPFLFSGTVAENICYACPGEASRAEIVADWRGRSATASGWRACRRAWRPRSASAAAASRWASASWSP